MYELRWNYEGSAVEATASNPGPLIDAATMAVSRSGGTMIVVHTIGDDWRRVVYWIDRDGLTGLDGSGCPDKGYRLPRADDRGDVCERGGARRSVSVAAMVGG